MMIVHYSGQYVRFLNVKQFLLPLLGGEEADAASRSLLAFSAMLRASSASFLAASRSLSAFTSASRVDHRSNQVRDF
jgi:hypothetical protein